MSLDALYVWLPIFENRKKDMFEEFAIRSVVGKVTVTLLQSCIISYFLW
jgi:hypothetical protein